MPYFKLSALCVLCPLGMLLSSGCSDPDSSNEATAEPSVGAGDAAQGGPLASGGSDAGGATESALGAPISKQCQGFPLEDITASPGGDVLPNRCQPFHPTLNNPYAVRCVDAWSWYKTPYAGDEYCILPPPADRGIQVGYHPQQDKYWEQVSKRDLSGYESPAAEWLVAPGGEETKTYHAPVSSPTPKQYYRTYFRMRTGSHHNIISMTDSTAPAAWLVTSGEALPAFFDSVNGNPIGTLGGQERPDDNTPVTQNRPPEDDGLYYAFPVNPNVYYNVHHFNTAERPVLKEGWVNVWWEESGTRAVNWFMGMARNQPFSLNVAPGATADLHYAFAPAVPVRLVRFFGHRHVWTTNFSSWIERKSGQTELIYQSFDWLDMPTYRYDSIVKNPTPNHEQRTDGASSGVVAVEPGDVLHFNCHIEYTDQRAAEENAPSPLSNGPLKFANQALTAEMCIAYGNVTGGDLGLPTESSTPIPAGATR